MVNYYLLYFFFESIICSNINLQLKFTFLPIHNNLPNKLAIIHDGFNDYNLRNTTLVLIYKTRKPN